MSRGVNMSKMKYESEKDEILKQGALFQGMDPYNINKQDLLHVARKLIDIYNAVYRSNALREEACEIVANLAMKHEEVLDIVIENSRNYTKNQYIDDASPYSPNSFDVLLKVGSSNEKVIPFLEEVIRDEWGISRWKAIEVLCNLDEADAKDIIRNIIKGKYPSRYLELESDLRIIESIKGKEFIEL